MINFKINPNPRGGWLVIERGKTIESLQIFFNDEEFLKNAKNQLPIQYYNNFMTCMSDSQFADENLNL